MQMFVLSIRSYNKAVLIPSTKVGENVIQYRHKVRFKCLEYVCHGDYFSSELY